jgi:hypothetical protein
MEELINTLKYADDCQRLADVFSELAKKARLRSVVLRAQKHGYKTRVESEWAKAIYAYEDTLTLNNKRKTHATRTWQMVKRYGIIKAAEKTVNRPVEPMGYRIFIERGMSDLPLSPLLHNTRKSLARTS